MLKRYIIAAAFITLPCAAALAQENKKTDDNAVVAQEIEVVRPYKPILAEAVKLRRSPNMDDIKTFKAKMNYATISHPLADNTGIQKLQAQEVFIQPDSTLINNYIKAGMGNNSAILAEGYFGLGQNADYNLGAYVQHVSQKGKLPGQADNRQQAAIAGKYITDNITYNAAIDFNRKGFNFYGQDFDNAFNPNFSADKQVLTNTGVMLGLKNRLNADSTINYYADLDFNNFSNFYAGRESTFNIKGGVTKNFNGFTAGVDLGGSFTSSKDSLMNVSNNLFNVLPHVGFTSRGAKIVVGARYMHDGLSFKKSRIFPYAEVNFMLVPEVLQFFGKVDGYVEKNTLATLSTQNQWINTSPVIKNSIYKLDVEAGIKGNASAAFGYLVKGYYRKITDMPLFVNNYDRSSRFDAIYNFGDTKLMGIQAEISMQLGTRFNWLATVNLDDYSSPAETYAWLKPSVRVQSTAVYNVNDKLAFNASLYAQGKSYAKLFTARPQTPAAQYVVPDKSIETSYELKGFADLGLGASYKINKRFGVFINSYNLFNNKYSKYLYYPTYGTTVYGGLTFAF